MAGLTLTTPALVLERRPAAADGWSGYHLFSPEAGLLLAMRREKQRGAATGAPDLFDEIEAGLESANQGRTWFLNECRILQRPEGIGRSYECLRGASVLSRLVTRNPVGPESRAAVHALLREAYAAFGQGQRPDIVLFKALFRFARSEGYPVKQEWLARLGSGEAAAAEDTLARPVRDAAAPAEAVARWQRDLEAYLRANAELELE